MMALLLCVQLEQAIRDLGAEEPGVREAAVVAIEAAGDEAASLLREALFWRWTIWGGGAPRGWRRCWATPMPTCARRRSRPS